MARKESIRSIASRLGRSPSTISRELERNGGSIYRSLFVHARGVLGEDGYVGFPGDPTSIIPNRAIMTGAFLDRVCRDTGITYDTLRHGLPGVTGLTWATVSE